MYMQDECSRPSLDNDASPSNSKKMQTDQSYLQDNRSSVKNDRASNERASVKARASENNTYYIYDTRSRPSNLVADQSSQTNLKHDLNELRNIRYPTHFVRPMHNESCLEKYKPDQLSQSKSQPSIPSQTLLQTADINTVQNNCQSTKSVPNVSMRSDKGKPSCSANNADTFNSTRSEADPNEACNVVYFTVPSSHTAQSNSLHPVVTQSSKYADDDTVYHSVRSEMVPKDTSYEGNLTAPSCQTAQSTFTHPVMEQSSKNLTKCFSLDTTVNVSVGLDPMESNETARSNTGVPCALSTSSRYFALNSASSKNIKEQTTAFHTRETGENCCSNVQHISTQSDTTTWRSACSEVCTTTETILTSLEQIVYCPRDQGPQLVEEQKSSSRFQTNWSDGQPDESSCFYDVDKSNITTSIQIDKTGPSRCSKIARSEGAEGSSCFYDVDKSNITTSIQIDKTGPSRCSKIARSECAEGSSSYYDVDKSNITTSIQIDRTGPPRFNKIARSEGAEGSSSYYDVDKSNIITSIQIDRSGPSRSNKIALFEGADGSSSYYDADKSTIVTSSKSCGAYDSEESEGDDMMPFNKSFGCEDKTSSRSQSVVAKLTCLCSPEERAKLGMMGHGITSDLPFMRVEESPIDCCIVPADPNLVSKTAIEADDAEKGESTKVVYCREEFRDCASTSDTSMAEKRHQKVEEDQNLKANNKTCCKKVTHTPRNQDVEIGQANRYKSAISTLENYKSMQSYAFVKQFNMAPTVSKSALSKGIAKCGKSLKSCPFKLEPVGVVMGSDNRFSSMEGPDEEQPEPATIEMNGKNLSSPMDGAMEYQEGPIDGSPQALMTNYNSCTSDCGQPPSLKERVVALLDTLGNSKDKSQERNANIQQLFRELTTLLRDEETEKDEELTPLTYKECMEAVAAGKKPTKAQSNPQHRTKGQKEHTECLDQLEKYLDKCFPLKKSRPPPQEIAAFERDPNFDPNAKPSDPDAYGLTKKSEVYFDLQSISECFHSCSLLVESKSGSLSRAGTFSDSAGPDANSRSPESEPQDAKTSDSRETSIIATIRSSSSNARDSKAGEGASASAQFEPDTGAEELVPKSGSILTESTESKAQSEPKSGSILTESTIDNSESRRENSGAEELVPKLGSILTESTESKAQSEPENSRAIEKSECRCGSTGAEELVSKSGSILTESTETKAQSEPENSRAIEDSECPCESTGAEELVPKSGSILTEPNESKAQSEPGNSRAIEKSECRCESTEAEELGPLTDRERLLCEYMMRRMCAMCEAEEEDIEEQTGGQTCTKGRCPPSEPCLCCHCRALVCDNQCKTVAKTLDAIRHDPVAETKYFIDSLICDIHAMDQVMAQNQTKPKHPKPSPTMGNGPGESFPVTITDVSSLGCRALYVRWQLEDCTAIGGYEIYVDGYLTNRFYNYRHEAGVVTNVDVTRGHQVILRAQAVGQEFAGDQPSCGELSHPHPEMLVGATRPWTPSVFYYEP